MDETQMTVRADFMALAWKWCALFLPTFCWPGLSHTATSNCKGEDKCGLIVCPDGNGNRTWLFAVFAADRKMLI